jgi:hypothetical protein
VFFICNIVGRLAAAHPYNEAGKDVGNCKILGNKSSFLERYTYSLRTVLEELLSKEALSKTQINLKLIYIKP